MVGPSPGDRRTEEPYKGSIFVYSNDHKCKYLLIDIYIHVYFRFSLSFFMQKALEKIVTVVEYNRQLVQLRQEKAAFCEQAERW